MTQEQVPMYQAPNPRLNATVNQAIDLVRVLDGLGLLTDGLIALPVVAAPTIAELTAKQLDILDEPLYLHLKFGKVRHNVALLLRRVTLYRPHALVTAKGLYDALTDTPQEFPDQLFSLEPVRAAVEKELAAILWGPKI